MVISRSTNVKTSLSKCYRWSAAQALITRPYSRTTPRSTRITTTKKTSYLSMYIINSKYPYWRTEYCWVSLYLLVVSYIYINNPSSDKGGLTKSGMQDIHTHRQKLLLQERCCSLPSYSLVGPWYFRSCCTLIHTTQRCIPFMNSRWAETIGQREIFFFYPSIFSLYRT